MSDQNDLFDKLTKDRLEGAKVLARRNMRGIWEGIVNKYSDQAHFIYELLQNADDVGATEVKFIAEPHGLIFIHNGKDRFTLTDPETEEDDTDQKRLGHINSITSAANSVKPGGKIGKFGVGFKAVFQYSNTPHIYDDFYRFKIDQYIVPYRLQDDHHLRRPEETLFYFPFNHPTRSATAAFVDISEKLEKLENPLLFLNNLKKLNWEILGGENGVYTKDIINVIEENGIIAEETELIHTIKSEPQKEKLWIFNKLFESPQDLTIHKCQVGFFIDTNNKISYKRPYPIHCFFRTKEDPGFRFILNAPFLLTDSREGIRAGNSWNKYLVSLLAELTSKGLLFIRSIAETNEFILIDDEIMDVVPTDDSVFPPEFEKDKLSFKPIYESIKKAFHKERILPGLNGRILEKSKAYWASDPNIVELFSDEQISEIMGNPDSGWVFPTRGRKVVQASKKNYLLQYMDGCVQDNLDEEKLIRRMTAEFLEKQEDTWILQLYQYIVERPSLTRDDKVGLRKRPFVMNRDRKAIPAFDDENILKVFLPNGRGNSFDTVYEPFSKNQDAVQFFKNIGITEPDIKAEIYNTILPQYVNENIDFDDYDTLKYHLLIFLDYYDTCSAQESETFEEKLRSTYFLASKSFQDPERKICFCRPKDIYLYSEELYLFFQVASETYYLDYSFYEEILTDSQMSNLFERFIRSLGVKIKPRILEKKLRITDEVEALFGFYDVPLSRTYVNQNIIIDKFIDGFPNLIENINHSQSILIWNVLRGLLNGLSYEESENKFGAIFEYVPLHSKNRQTTFVSNINSSLLKTFQTSTWLFDKNNQVKRPDLINIQDLHSDYEINCRESLILLRLCGSKDISLTIVGLQPDQYRAFQLGYKLLELGIDDQSLDELIKNYRKDKHSGDTGIEEIPNLKGGQIQDIITDITNRIEGSGMRPLPIDETDTETDGFVSDWLSQKKEEVAIELVEVQRRHQLSLDIVAAPRYSFQWFSKLLELEVIKSSETNTTGKEISIQFTKVEREPGTERTLILKHPNRYIPANIEDIGDLTVKFHTAQEVQSLSIEVVNVKEYTLRAKLKNPGDLNTLNLEAITKVVIDIKNPVFIVEEFFKAFTKLPYDPLFNMRDNLTPNIDFIFGPPGTGKTTYLAEKCLIPFMQRPEPLKILVLTPTNKAADVLTQRIIESMGEDETYFEWLLRFGTTGEPQLEQSGLVVDKNFDIRSKPRNVVITTIARFAYDGFFPDGLYPLKFSQLTWDYIIIDEASMIPAYQMALVLFQKIDAQFIIAGDPFQIQPITGVDDWGEENIYTMVQLNSFVEPTTIPHSYHVINLSTQYRSIPSLGDVFSHFTYGGHLKHHRKSNERRPLQLDGLNIQPLNLIKFPVSPNESIYKSKRLKNTTPYHVYAALFAVEFARYLAGQIVHNHSEHYRIGVICPYRAQASLIEKLIARMILDHANVSIQVGTIHGFQGDECDIIISVFNPPPGISTSPRMFLNKQNILNVSISRARDYIFVLMPDDETEKIGNLIRVRQIEHLMRTLTPADFSFFHSHDIEEVIFGNPDYIYENAFATSHHSVNVYALPEKVYEIRADEQAVDVQIQPAPKLARKNVWE